MQSTKTSAKARLTEACLAASGIRLMRFEILEGSVHTSPGSHLTFAIDLPTGATTRSYSVVDDGRFPELISVAIKLEEPGRGGSRFMWSLQPGDEVRIVESGNSMPLSFDRSDYVVIAGGIGVTPMTAIVAALCASGRSVSMVYCARSREHAAFTQRLTDLLGEKLRFHYDDEGDFLDVEGLVAGIGEGTQVYICGPLGLMNAVRSAWSARGLPGRDLRFETFANSGGEASRPFDVTVEETGRTVHVPAGQTLLDALVHSGHDIMFECLKGECGLCKLVVTKADGAIDHRDVFLSEREKETGESLCACVSRLSGGHAHIRIDGISHGRSG